MKVALVVTGLLLLLVANLLMVYSTALTPYLRQGEGFQNAAASTTAPVMPPPGAPPAIPGLNAPVGMASMDPTVSRNASSSTTTMVPGAAPVKEAFTSYYLENGAGAKDSYEPMGAYDGVTLPTGNNVSQWRYTAPNEKLNGAEFQPGPDSLFIFKNNQCKPECCGASFSCGGGCVCTTPQQRQYIASRGSNRTQPEDGF
jgi:hypothetical protein